MPQPSGHIPTDQTFNDHSGCLNHPVNGFAALRHNSHRSDVESDPIRPGSSVVPTTGS